MCSHPSTHSPTHLAALPPSHTFILTHRPPPSTPSPSPVGFCTTRASVPLRPAPNPLGSFPFTAEFEGLLLRAFLKAEGTPLQREGKAALTQQLPPRPRYPPYKVADRGLERGFSQQLFFVGRRRRDAFPQGMGIVKSERPCGSCSPSSTPLLGAPPPAAPTSRPRPAEATAGCLRH